VRFVQIQRNGFMETKPQATKPQSEARAPRPWECLPDESETDYNRFLAYLLAGPDRTLGASKGVKGRRASGHPLGTSGG
jgi:hypothetical protein